MLRSHFPGATTIGFQIIAMHRYSPSNYKMEAVGVALAALLLATGSAHSQSVRSQGEANAYPSMHLVLVADFDLSGEGSHPNWDNTAWVELARRPGGSHDYQTRIKALYSSTGLYMLLDATDTRLSATLQEDFLDLWTEDVFEIFLWPDERHPIYFEYEISPLGYELPLLVPNLDDRFLGWRPWRYQGERRVRKSTAAVGGSKEPLAAIQAWRAEVFIPFELLRPLISTPPVPGTSWRANFYRLDYDDGSTTGWEWAPVGPSFHEFERFGYLIFQ